MLDAIRKRGVLKVGTAGDYQPMSYMDPETSTYVGFDAELAEDLAASLGVEIEYVKTSWPTLMAGKNGRLTVKIPGNKVDEYRELFTGEGGLDGSIKAA